MRAEIEAQFRAFVSTGLALDHVNVHRHFHLHPIVAAMVIDIGAPFGARAMRVPREPPRMVQSSRLNGKIIEDLCSRLLGRRARRCGVMSPDAVFGLRWSGGMTRARLRLLLDSLPSRILGDLPASGDARRFSGLRARQPMCRGAGGSRRSSECRGARTIRPSPRGISGRGRLAQRCGRRACRLRRSLVECWLSCRVFLCQRKFLASDGGLALRGTQ